MFMRAVHPGEVLKDELDELGVTPTEFARPIDVPPDQPDHRRRACRDRRHRLDFGYWFGTEPQFWLNLQSAYEIRIADAGRSSCIAIQTSNLKENSCNKWTRSGLRAMGIRDKPTSLALPNC
jgi:addiction module HigA family antidote